MYDWTPWFTFASMEMATPPFMGVDIPYHTMLRWITIPYHRIASFDYVTYGFSTSHTKYTQWLNRDVLSPFMCDFIWDFGYPKLSETTRCCFFPSYVCLFSKPLFLLQLPNKIMLIIDQLSYSWALFSAISFGTHRILVLPRQFRLSTLSRPGVRPNPTR